VEVRERTRVLQRWSVPALIAVTVLTGIAVVGLLVWGAGDRPDDVEALYDEIVPAEGEETAYDIPLAWENAELFLEWNYQIYDHLSSADKELVLEALDPLVAPCCDDYNLPGCCCEGANLLCNLVRTARGLAAHMAVEGGFAADEITESVLQWLSFAHGDYYVAAELEKHGGNPGEHGITTEGACYRGMCETPLRDGGCGGMHELKIGGQGV